VTANGVGCALCASALVIAAATSQLAGGCGKRTASVPTNAELLLLSTTTFARFSRTTAAIASATSSNAVPNANCLISTTPIVAARAFGFVQCSPRSTTIGERNMTTVFIEARPKGRREGTAIVDYVVEEQGDRVLKAFKTLAEAITWAKSEGHSPHVARVRHLNDKKIPDHWRPV
jgi:hypothetical protein